MNHGKTQVTIQLPWGTIHAKGTRLLCSDGKVRAPSYLASTPDTFYSTPASMRIRGKTVPGYMCVEEATHVTLEFTVRAYVFRHHLGPNKPFPDWPLPYTPEYLKLILSAQ